MNKLWYLKRCDLFHGLDNKTMNDIMAVARDRNVSKKELILRPDADTGVMLILKKGRVRLFKLSSEGKMITLAILKDGDIFGALSAIKSGMSGAYAETLEDSYICAINQKDLLGIIRKTPELAVSLIAKINQRLKESEDRIADLVFRDVPGRISSVLLKLAERFGKDGDGGTRISIKLTHQELADMVGASRETVTIILNEFKDDKTLSISEKYITITDEKMLRQWSGGG